ncbi:MAG: restriction endonuclease subunit S [Candidatus ainarchaeum sp.]|nr:restriction endonuclease subunit S [Candidatus ainarchaeum sp.]
MKNVLITNYVDILAPKVKVFSKSKRYVATGDVIKNKIISFSEFTFDSKPSRANIQAINGDILIAKMKDTNKVLLINKDNENNMYSTGFALFRIKDKNFIDPKYLYFWFLSNDFQTFKNKNSSGATQKAIRDQELKKSKIPFVSLAQQKKIVSILEKAEKLKEKRKEANKLTEEYLNSIFNEIYYNKNFEEIKLSDNKYFHIIMGQSPKGNSYNHVGEGTPFFQGKKEFRDKYPTVEQWTTKPSKMAQSNDILISVRAPVGATNLSNIDCCIGRGLAAIRCKKGIETDFVYSFLKVKKKEIENLGNGSTFKAITSKQLLDIKIPIPPNSSQKKFTEIVEKVEKIKENQKQSDKELNNLFNSLMQKAFRGELI